MSLNIDEILYRKDSRLDRRPAQATGKNLQPPLKRLRSDAGRDQQNGGRGEVDAEALLKAAEEVEVEQVDERNVRRLIAAFEKRVLKNQEMRIKFSDQPEKFMESEIELNVAVQELHSLATAPQHYSLLIETNAVQNLLYLLNHENADVSCTAVHLLQELTDIDALIDNEEAAGTISNLLIDGQLIGALVKNLERLDEANNRDEADGVYNTLAVVENAFEFKPDELTPHLLRHGFLAWLLKRLRAKMPFDSNSLYCSEILAVLLQNSDQCKRALGQDLDGVDVLLQQLAAYKRHNPQNADEIEFMENLFNCLCACLMEKENLHKFLDGEGLQLMNLMLREKKMSRESALKVLDYATTGKMAKENCDKFVDILGLRTLFPLFMKTPAKHKRKGHSAEEHEEHVCAIVASLLKYCSTAQKQRILGKFTEGDCEKVERLMELHFRYLEKVDRFDANNEIQRKKSTPTDDDMSEEEIYLQKLDAGLFTLQLVDFILAEICINGPPTVKERVQKILNMKNSSLKVIKRILDQYAENMGSTTAEKNDEKQYLTAILNKLWA